MAILRVLGWLLVVTLLASCSGRSGNLGMIRRVNPPVASIQQLALRDDGSWHLVLRLNNFSTVPMRFVLVESRLWIDGADAGHFELSPAMQVPRLNAEVQDLEFEPAPAARAAFEDAAGRGFSYRLEGSIRTEEPGGNFPFYYDGRLTPVPGRPGEFR
jgi:hypothetical protein